MPVNQLQQNQFAIAELESGQTTLTLVGSPQINFNALTDGSGNVSLSVTVVFTPAMLNQSANAENIPDTLPYSSVYNLVDNQYSSGSVTVQTSLSGESTIINITSLNLITNSAKGRYGSEEF